MNTTYTSSDMCLTHYEWNTDHRETPLAYSLDNETLELLQGYEVLCFGNTFLDLYMPDHQVSDLHGLENVLAYHLPFYLTAKKDIASWLARNLYFIKSPLSRDEQPDITRYRDALKKTAGCNF